jgi:hypothetical protein
MWEMLNILKSLPLHVVRKGRERYSNSKRDIILDCDPEDEGTVMFQKLGTFLHSVRDQYPSRLVTLSLLLLEPPFSHIPHFFCKNPYLISPSKMISICSQIHVKHINKLCSNNFQFLRIKYDGK